MFLNATHVACAFNVFFCDHIEINILFSLIVSLNKFGHLGQVNLQNLMSSGYVC